MPTDDTTLEELKQSDTAIQRFVATLSDFDIEETTATALTLQLVGGVPKTHNGISIRGQIHMGVVVDTHVNFPHLVDYLCTVSPNSQRLNAARVGYPELIGWIKNSTNPGLESGVITDDSNQFIPIMNPYALDDVLIDLLTELIGTGTVTITKHNIQEVVDTPASILLVGYAVWVQFDPYVQLVEQLPIDPQLRPLLDVICTDTDGRENAPEHPPLPEDLARDYIEAARALEPELPVHIEELLQEFLVEHEPNIQSADSLPSQATYRIQRLAEASAKARFADEVTTDDAMRAQSVYQQPHRDEARQKERARNETPNIDAPVAGDEDKHRRDIIRDILQEHDRPLDYETIIDNTLDRGAGMTDIPILLGELRAMGEVGVTADDEWYYRTENTAGDDQQTLWRFYE